MSRNILQCFSLPSSPDIKCMKVMLQHYPIAKQLRTARGNLAWHVHGNANHMVTQSTRPWACMRNISLVINASSIRPKCKCPVEQLWTSLGSCVEADCLLISAVLNCIITTGNICVAWMQIEPCLDRLPLGGHLGRWCIAVGNAYIFPGIIETSTKYALMYALPMTAVS